MTIQHIIPLSVAVSVMTATLALWRNDTVIRGFFLIVKHNANQSERGQDGHEWR